jgi:hypothetical protein
VVLLFKIEKNKYSDSFVFETWTWTYRERFRLFVQKRYSVTTRKFLGVPDRSPFMTVHRSWPFTVHDRSPFMTVHRSWPFTVHDRSPFMTVHRSWPFTVHDRSPFMTVHRSWPFTVPDRYHDRSWPFLKRSETVRNGHGNGQKRSGAVDGKGRWTVWNDHTVQDKRSETIAKSRSRCVHGTFTVLSRFKNERITVNITSKLLEFFGLLFGL